MRDIEVAYQEIVDFLKDNYEKTLLLCGIANKEKSLSVLNALNSQGSLKGLVYLIHTNKNGIENFFRRAELYNIRLPKKYGDGVKVLNLTLYFDKWDAKRDRNKYDNYVFDFMIIWPIQSITKYKDEIQSLKDMVESQQTKKIIYLSYGEPGINLESFRSTVDKIVRLDCENDNPQEYQRIMSLYEEDKYVFPS